MMTGKTGHKTKCKMCGALFSRERQSARYCSGACRARASRVAAGRAPDVHQASVRRNLTKAGQVLSKVCHACGQSFTVSGKEAKRRYCSDACRQRAFRRRSKAGVL